jgi:DHA2 family multidrug resistance protein
MNEPVDDKISVKIWAGYLALCLGMFMAILDIQIVASSLPNIQSALNIPFDNLSWIQTAYLIAEIVAIPLTGWLTRLMSVRGLFIFAVTGFTLASIGCATSAHFETLLIFRAIQGFCGGALIPIVFTSIFTLFPKRMHIFAGTIGGLFAMIAPAIGPVLGGYITENYSWQWLFLVNVTPGIIVTIIAAFCVRIGKPDWKLFRHLDFIVVLLAAICLASLELILKEGPKHHWHGNLITPLMILFAVTGILTIRRSLAASEPVIDIRCFTDRSFTIGCFYSFVLGMGLFGSVYLTPLYLGAVRQHTPFEIGKIMIVMGVAQLIVAPIAAFAEKRISPVWLTGFGYGLFAAGLITNGYMTFNTDFDGLFWPQIFRGVAVLFCLLPTTNLALQTQPINRMSNASGLFNLMRNLGGAIGIALIDTILEQRTPTHAAKLGEKLQSGDIVTAKLIGLPMAQFHKLLSPKSAMHMQGFIEPLIQRTALVLSFNEAWLMLGAVFLLAFLAVPLMRRSH